MTNYFNSEAIGSSLLAQCIVSVDPLQVCTDRATKEIKPTSAMEIGKNFEDLVEVEYGEFDFWEKYFKSNFKTMPSGIVEILEKDELTERALAVSNGYVYKDNGELHGTYKRKHAMLDQIKAHDYRRPIPETTWEKLEIMLARFWNCPFKLRRHAFTIKEWMRERADVLFQVEYFWNNDGAECRAKFDMIWLVKFGSETYAVPFDLKVTGDEVVGQKSFGAFVTNWRKKYIWQSKHYHEGFKRWCLENDYLPYDKMPYIIQESDWPQITNIWMLHESRLEYLDGPYQAALQEIQKWIDEGKPVRGFIEQQIVNEYGRTWRE